jgi:hypothetical protein
MAQIASLLPVNAEESPWRSSSSWPSAYAIDIPRVTRIDPSDHLKHSAQAAGIMRQAATTRSRLLRVQTARLKREKSNAATDAAAWIRHIALGPSRAATWGTPDMWTAEEPEDRPGPARADRCGSDTVVEEAGGSSADGTVAATLPDAPAANGATARSVSDFETKSQNAGNETAVRRRGSGFTFVDPLAGRPPARSASVSETESKITGNETTTRRGGPLSVTADGTVILVGLRPGSKPPCKQT